jgi:hypothetical protein
MTPEQMQAMFAQMAQLMGNAQAGNVSRPLVKSFNEMAQDFYPNGDWTGDIAVQGLRESLSKAMGIDVAAGNGIAGTGALQLENLDATMTEVLINERWLKLWNAIPKVPSKNALYEYNRKEDYGSFRGSMGFPEGGAPFGSEATYNRLTEVIRYMGERGGITHQLVVADSHGGVHVNPTAQVNRNTTMRLLAKTERQLVHGLSTIKHESGGVVNYDGLIPRMRTQRATNVYNMKGAALSFSKLEEISYNLFDSGKLLDFGKLKGFATGYVASDLGALLRASERSTVSGSGKPDLIPGTPFGGWNSQFGLLPMEASQFLDAVPNDSPTIVADLGAPPATVAPTFAAPAGSGSDMPAGSAYYFVSTFNSKGESVAVPSASAATFTSGQSTTVTITRENTAIGYRLYRGATNSPALAKWIATIPQPASGNATYVDTNQVFPGSGRYIIFNADNEDIAIPQLSPLVKWPLAVVNTTVEFLLLLYHSLVIKAPERVIVVENIGRAP